MNSNHIASCAWERTTTAECEYRDTHHYCPHPEHACTCPPQVVLFESGDEQRQTWCDHCSADLNGVKHVLCERCYREYADSTNTRESLRAAILDWLARRCDRAPVCGNCTYCRVAKFVQSLEPAAPSEPLQPTGEEEQWTSDGCGLFRNGAWVTSTAVPEVAAFLARRLNERTRPTTSLETPIGGEQLHDEMERDAMIETIKELEKDRDALRQVARMALQQFEFTYGKRTRGWDAVYLMERLQSVIADSEGSNEFQPLPAFRTTKEAMQYAHKHNLPSVIPVTADNEGEGK